MLLLLLFSFVQISVCIARNGYGSHPMLKQTNKHVLRGLSGSMCLENWEDQERDALVSERVVELLGGSVCSLLAVADEM